MQIKKNGSVIEFIIEGSIGEGSPLFQQPVQDATEIVINGEKMTYMNSIGVKNWIMWTVRIPQKAKLVLVKAPLVLINQAATVVGFMPPNGIVQSFSAPFVCPECNNEQMELLTLDKDYGYATPSAIRWYKIPPAFCNKCKTEMEADFIEAKVFTFLDRR